MQSRTQSKVEDPAKQSNNQSLQQRIPWWKDMGPAAYAELQLQPVREVSLQSVDVVVIGGGVAGLSAALAIKKRDAAVRVLVLEKEDMLGYGATGQNAGIFTPGINMAMSELPPDSSALAFYPETTALFHTLIEQGRMPGTLLYARKTGAINMATSKRAALKLERETYIRGRAGLQAELWTPAQVAEATQGRLNTRSVVNAMWLPDEGRIHPLTLLAHLAQQARQIYNVAIAGQAQLTQYEPASAPGWRVTLADGTTFQARALVDCVGPIVGANARIYALAFAADFPENFPLFWDASPYTYADYRPGHGRLGVSGGRYGKAGVTANDASYYQRLADATRRWVPELAGKRPTYKWAVDLAVTAEMIPHMRMLGGSAPGVAIEGLGAQGVLPGMILAQQAAEYIFDRLAHY